MKREVIRIRGAAYIALDTVARCYQVEVTWVEEADELGLLGAGELVEDRLCVEAAMLGRLARILRLHRQLGLDLMGIATMWERELGDR